MKVKRDIREEPAYQELVVLLKAQKPERQALLVETLEHLASEEEAEERGVYRVEEAAKVLGVKPNAIRVWLRQGKLPGKKIGKLWMIPKDAVNTFITK